MKVLYFAQLREARGCESESVQAAQGTTLAQLFATLFDGPLSKMPVAFAQNQAYVRGTTLLEDGAEIAFIPPVGGG